MAVTRIRVSADWAGGLPTALGSARQREGVGPRPIRYRPATETPASADAHTSASKTKNRAYRNYKVGTLAAYSGGMASPAGFLNGRMRGPTLERVTKRTTAAALPVIPTAPTALSWPHPNARTRFRCTDRRGSSAASGSPSPAAP